jgi:hypothetical protein
VNPTLADNHPTWNNDYTAYFRPLEKNFAIISKGSNPTIRNVFEELTAENLDNIFANNQDSVLDIVKRHADVETNYRENFVSLHYKDKDGATQYVRYDLTLPEDLMLFTELQAAFSIGKALSSPDVTALVQDDYPDFYSISFNSVTYLTEKYGRHSTQVIGALYLLDKSIPLIYDRFSTLYPNRLLSEVVLLGSHPSTLSANNPDKRPLISILNRLVPNQNILDSGLFPSLYTHNDEFCEILDLQLNEDDIGFQVFCLPSRSSVNSLERQAPVFFTQQSMTSRNAVDQVVYYNDVAKYQIVLWISLLLLFFTIWVVYSIAYMSFKKDTIIYSTFNPKWENREAKRK